MSVLARYVPPAVATHMQNMQSRLAAARARSAEMTTRAVRSAECVVTGGVLGYVEGRYDRTELMGAPLAPLVGVGAHLAAFTMGGKDAEHLHAVGDACLTVHAANVGREIGRERKAAASQAPTTTTTSFYGQRAA